LGGALATAIAAFLLLLASCYVDSDLFFIALSVLLVFAGVLTGCAVLTRMRRPSVAKDWGKLLALVVLALVVATGTIAFTGLLLLLAFLTTCAPPWPL
jgi:hypothetical protein